MPPALGQGAYFVLFFIVLIDNSLSYHIKYNICIGRSAKGRWRMAVRYFIGERCVGCGGCRSVCPEKCIGGTGHPLRIDDKRCIRCGRCALACPRRAIVRKDEEVTV